MPSYRSFAATGLALLTTAASVGALPVKLAARAPPQALPAKATANDLKFQPAMDFDTDGCYNTPAIGPDGTINPGLDNRNTGLSSDCHDLSDLQNNNVYSRARCNNGWCAYVYDYYFEKEYASRHVPYPPWTHLLTSILIVSLYHTSFLIRVIETIGNVRSTPLSHTTRRANSPNLTDCIDIVVWAQNGEAKYVAASAHGDYEVKPASDVRWQGTHPKMVYHKDGLGTHDFRFGNTDDDNIENATGAWFFGSLVSWNGFPSMSLMDKLVAYDFGSANFALKDDSFAGNLDKARGGFIPEFDINLDDGSPGNP
ncbi:hypothetical protein RRF57_012340 [Xylaria bambusicola]|uniref:Uncharacterized protein n=1 Tax=Xylaria bambusicola TaxID=326684 RepID=A0AAN7UWB6_9PEZI